MCIMGGIDVQPVQPYNDSQRFNVVVRSIRIVRTLYHSECEKDSNNLFDLTDKAPGPSPSIAQHTAVNTRSGFWPGRLKKIATSGDTTTNKNTMDKVPLPPLIRMVRAYGRAARRPCRRACLYMCSHQARKKRFVIDSFATKKMLQARGTLRPWQRATRRALDG